MFYANTRAPALRLPDLELQGGSSDEVTVDMIDERAYVLSVEKAAKYVGELELSMASLDDAFNHAKNPVA